MRTAAWLVVIELALASGCALHPATDPGDGGPAVRTDAGVGFSFATVEAHPLNIHVHGADGAGIANAVVQVRRVHDGHLADVLFRGRTDHEGRIRAPLSTIAADDGACVVIQRLGWRGPWDDEEARNQAGPFAPSSRLVVGEAMLGSLDVVLEPR